jgi:TonB family protein
VAFDQYKTQVLLLHSEQSTLDSLSSGFGDRYTVHCATSGSEALNTLVETPINVIITAQNLPGMSGLEALREAKKRSPDTVGILLAGSADQGLEALVGDKEVFQVVRGNVTGDALLKLVDSATRQMRLMALAESANDTAAHPDEPAEHIVMETSENGSAIISGGTGRMPALNPEKVSAAAAVGSQSVDVLVLTKDQEFLTTIIESSRGMHEVHYANTLAQAEETIRQHNVGVAVVDAAMVGQKVEQLTLHLRKGEPRLVSIVAGRRDDGEMLMDLINRGKVYRFLLKPVSPGRARLAVEASVKHHLEAPDAAFKIPGSAAPAKPLPKAAPKAQPKPAAKPAPTPAPKAKAPAKPAAATPAAPAPQKAAKPATTAPAAKAAPVDPPLGDLNIESPIDEGLSSAFGDDDTSFTETVTGLFSSVSKKLKGDSSEPPASPDETAMNIPSAMSAGGAGGSPARSPKIIGIAAVALIAVATAAFFFMGGEDDAAIMTDPVADDAAALATPAGDNVTEAAQSSVDIDALVEEARLARDAGQIFNPAGSNAIELYMAAVNADPSNVLVVAELDAVVQQALQMAETALLESRVDDAAAALQRVSVADPSNSRLPFLSAQLWQMQLRSHLTNARAAIRDERFEDAGNALAAAIALNLGDTGEIEEVRAELNRARSAQQVGGVLGKANAHLQEGNLLSPPNDNARYYYELLLASDPTNTAARQGLDAVASKVVLQARSEIDAGNLDAAANLLGQAREIDPASKDLDATAAALSGARDAIANRIRQAEEERLRIQAANRQAAAEQAAAEQAAAEQAAAEQAAAEQAAAEQAAAEQAAAEQAAAEQAAAEQAAAEQAPAAKPDPGVASSKPAGASESVSQPVARQATPAPTPVAVGDQSPVSVSSLSRTRYVAPKYPRTAQRRNLSGWVDVVFTVAMDGSVKDLEVRSAEPEGVFDSAALRAVEKWEFEPVIENGVLVEKRAGVRMMFALE